MKNRKAATGLRFLRFPAAQRRARLSRRSFRTSMKPSKDACRSLRIHGSHHIYGREGSIVRLSIPVSLKPGLLRHLAKQAEIHEDDL